MKPKRVMVVLLSVLVLGACGSEGDAGADACELYKTGGAIAPTVELEEIKTMLEDLDAPTRRAFADLITAADATTFEDRAAKPAAAAEVRSTCLAEHGVEITS